MTFISFKSETRQANIFSHGVNHHLNLHLKKQKLELTLQPLCLFFRFDAWMKTFRRVCVNIRKTSEAD